MHLVTKRRSIRLKMNEFSEKFTDDHAAGSEVNSCPLSVWSLCLKRDFVLGLVWLVFSIVMDYVGLIWIEFVIWLGI